MNDHDDAPLSEREALMMAWVDDELDTTDRRRFESMMAEDAELAAEAADHRRLLDLGRSADRLEPTDREIRRFWARFYNRAEWRLGWVLILLGGTTLLGYGVYELLVSDLSWLVKTASLAVLVGSSLLLWSTIRQRMRTGRFDRYRGVLR